MKKITATVAAIILATASYAGGPNGNNGQGNNCQGNSCGTPPLNGPSAAPLPTNGPISIIRNDWTTIAPSYTTVNTSIDTAMRDVSRSVIQINRAPVRSIVRNVTISATAGNRSSTRVSGNTISASAVGNSSVICITRN